MWNWLRRLFGAYNTDVAPTGVPQLPPDAPEVPEELIETLEFTKKNARAQAKLMARVDEIDAGIHTRIDDLRAAIAALASRPAPTPAPIQNSETQGLLWAEILDAMDLLQNAIDSLDQSRDDGVAEGLRGVLRRLDRALSHGRIERRGAVGEPIDGRLFKVLGAHELTDLPPDRIARVVRAAALRDGKVLREGEVFTGRETQ